MFTVDQLSVQLNIWIVLTKNINTGIHRAICHQVKILQNSVPLNQGIGNDVIVKYTYIYPKPTPVFHLHTTDKDEDYIMFSPRTSISILPPLKYVFSR